MPGCTTFSTGHDSLQLNKGDGESPGPNQGRGGKGEGRAVQLFICTADINIEIWFVSADANGKNKHFLSLLVNLCLVITWIIPKESTQIIHLPCSSCMSHTRNMSWLRGKDFCNMYSSSKSCYNMMIFEVIKWDNCYYSNAFLKHTDFSTMLICPFLTSKLILL